MLEDNMFEQRIAIEASMLRSDFPEFEPVGGDLTHWRGKVQGTGLHSSGFFNVEIIILREFPFEPPEIRWLTPIWHPNFDEKTNNACIDLLTTNWSPFLNIVTIIHAILEMIQKPNPSNPFNQKAAFEYLNSWERYVEHVREYLKEAK